MNIYESLTAVMAEVQPIAKGQTNEQQGFKYRGIDDIMNDIQPLLVKHQIFAVPEVLEHQREERKSSKGTNLLYSVMRIKYTFFAADGTSIEAVVVGEGMDTGDKASNKAMAVAFKYALLQVLCIPTADTKDPDGESHETTPKIKNKVEQAKKDNPIDRKITDVEWHEIVKLAGGDTKKATAAALKHGYKGIREIPFSALETIKNEFPSPVGANQKASQADLKLILDAAKGDPIKVAQACAMFGFTASGDVLKKDVQRIINFLTPLPFGDDEWTEERE